MNILRRASDRVILFVFLALPMLPMRGDLGLLVDAQGVPESVTTPYINVTPTCYTLIKSANPTAGGSVNASPAPNCNGGTGSTSVTVVQLMPVPASGYVFSSWSGPNAGDIINTGGVYTIVMNGDKTVQANFPRADITPPTAQLVKPAADNYLGATFVTGKAFRLVGTAQDQSGIRSAWFELCPEGPWACQQQWNLTGGGWVAIGKDIPAVATPGVPGQWETTWDCTTEPDGYHFIRICAEDNDGNRNCSDGRADQPLTDQGSGNHLNPYADAHWVYVDDRVEIPLRMGWNLISTPLMPYDTKIESVLADLIANKTVKQVVTRVWTGSAFQWEVWTPTMRGPQSLTTLEDGKGYWINMSAEDELTIVGTWTTPEDGGTAPEYPVYAGWNLIGYTHWGRPTIRPTDTVMEYLGSGLMPYVAGPLYFDNNVYKYPKPSDNMVLGKGYWLATSEDGVIWP